MNKKPTCFRCCGTYNREDHDCEIYGPYHPDIFHCPQSPLTNEQRNQETEHPKQTHSELVASAAKWLKRHDENTIVPNCSLIYMEQKSLANTGEIPDVIGFGGEISVVIECKASRKDFLADAKRPFRSLADGMGNQRYFFAEKGTIDGRSLPASWGLIEIEGTEISIKERSICVHANYKSERELLLSVIRSMNK